MLELAGGIALGMDIADFLELERAFHGQREHGAPAEEQDIGGPRQLMRHIAHAVFHLQGLGDQAGRLEQGLDQSGLLVRADPATRHAGGDRQRQQAGDLGGEGLGRGDADLGTGMGRPQILRLAGHG